MKILRACIERYRGKIILRGIEVKEENGFSFVQSFYMPLNSIQSRKLADLLEAFAKENQGGEI